MFVNHVKASTLLQSFMWVLNKPHLPTC